MLHNVEISRTAYELILLLDKTNQVMTVDSLLGPVSEESRELQRKATEKAHTLFQLLREEWPYIDLEWLKETALKEVGLFQ